MSIKADVNELYLINSEITRLRKRIKELNKIAQIINTRITAYLTEKEQPGVKYKGNEIRLTQKTKRISKKKKEQEDDVLEILMNNGINNAKDVLKQIIEARKGEPVDYTKIEIKPQKNKKIL
jgi:hypothetical protein